ncbi:hypothetical protein CFBP6626_24225 (plasmid) [Agrobacterium tumefaciens]|nr:hypothetical protein CFBP6626_24225 [Agrobacterium tumefaciens]
MRTAALSAAALPPILAEICLKDRKTGRFRSSWATDSVICGRKSTIIDKGYLSMVDISTVNHSHWRTIKCE